MPSELFSDNALQNNTGVIEQNQQKLRILNIAGRLFSEKGYMATTIDDVAKAAQVSKPTIYYYFKGKRQLLFQYADYMITKVIELANPIIRSDLSPREKLKALMISHMEWMLQSKSRRGIVFLDVSIRSVLPRKLYNDYLEKEHLYFRYFMDVIDKIISHRRIKNSDPRITTFLIFGTMNSAGNWYNPRGKLTPTDIAHYIYDHIIEL